MCGSIFSELTFIVSISSDLNYTIKSSSLAPSSPVGPRRSRCVGLSSRGSHLYAFPCGTFPAASLQELAR
ncbi:unnamed protein product [Chondrus crispus]|uniref:Uncharacterized protein n=1 Tax=Chondrus crispus TaxID=2769 RepID=R7Q8K9_CHOCR|nr:unnamed protein product [Chondrus crispus]CDF34867.1 unnamed protein product [Chondrus crispus]|eukprot:XP_005714686.1 unnamed protein product [Chondrus crispus]